MALLHFLYAFLMKPSMVVSVTKENIQNKAGRFNEVAYFYNTKCSQY